MQYLTSALLIPIPEVVFPCGSISIKSTLLPNVARQALKLTAVVVLPTPPFWFAIAMTRPLVTNESSLRNTVASKILSNIVLQNGSHVGTSFQTNFSLHHFFFQTEGGIRYSRERFHDAMT